jgi:hypothetical protein
MLPTYHSFIMRYCLKFVLLSLIVLEFTGCATMMGTGEQVVPVPRAPIAMILDAGSVYVRIRNTSGSRLHVIGVVTRGQDSPYIDSNQPGAFDMHLYPGEEGTVFSGGNGGADNTFYIRLKNWSVE